MPTIAEPRLLIVEGGAHEAMAAARAELARIEAERKAATRPEARCLDAALKYTRRGWPVLPLHFVVEGACSCGDPACGSPCKHPLSQLVPHGFKDATTDEATIRRWWARFPQANVGIRTGAVSRLVVLDVDPAHGGERSLASLIGQHGDLGGAPQVRTGGGGRHCYFRHPGTGRVIKNSVGSLGPGLDLRGDNGYVVAPPSRTAKGEYAWIR